MKKLVSLLLITVLLFAAVLSVAACSEKEPTASAAATIAEWQSKYTAGDFGIHSKKDPFVELKLSTGESIRLELFPNVAPISVNNFITYVQEGFYEGVAFHRIRKGEMIQTGGFEIVDDNYVQKEATHPAIQGEFLANGVVNTLSHVRGVLSMARTPAFNSATSQIFICAELGQDVTASYNGSYAAFGRVIDEESMAVVARLENVETHAEYVYYGETPVSASDVPVTRVTITKATLVWDK